MYKNYQFNATVLSLLQTFFDSLNGWYVNISASEMVDFEGTHLDDGFDPDQEVWLDENDKTKDEVVEAAIEHLRK